MLARPPSEVAATPCEIVAPRAAVAAELAEIAAACAQDAGQPIALKKSVAGPTAEASLLPLRFTLPRSLRPYSWLRDDYTEQNTGQTFGFAAQPHLLGTFGLDLIVPQPRSRLGVNFYRIFAYAVYVPVGTTTTVTDRAAFGNLDAYAVLSLSPPLAVHPERTQPSRHRGPPHAWDHQRRRRLHRLQPHHRAQPALLLRRAQSRLVNPLHCSPPVLFFNPPRPFPSPAFALTSS